MITQDLWQQEVGWIALSGSLSLWGCPLASAPGLARDLEGEFLSGPHSEESFLQ